MSGTQLVRLTLTEHSEDPMLSTMDTDCLSGLSKLQHMEISPKVPGTVWSMQGLLNSLDSLERFAILGNGKFKDHWYLHWLYFPT